MECNNLNEMRAQWRRQQDELERHRHRELTIQRRLQAIRDQMANEGTADTPTANLQKELNSLREERAEIQQEVLTLSQIAARTTRVLAVMSLADAMEAIEAAKNDTGPDSRHKWEVARNRLLDGLPERLAVLIDDEGLRRLAKRTGISHTYVSRLLRGQRPTDAPLEALFTGYPDAFPDIPRMLKAFPQTAPHAGRPLKKLNEIDESLGAMDMATLAKRPQYRLDDSGKTKRIAGALDALVAPFSGAGVDYLLRIEADWLAPEIRPGDVVLVSVNALPHPDSILLVEDGKNGSSLRRLITDAEGRTIYASNCPDRYPALSPSDARMTGVVVGMLRAVRLV